MTVEYISAHDWLLLRELDEDDEEELLQQWQQHNSDEGENT